MHPLRTLASALAAVVLAVPSSLAYSVRRNPLRSVSFVDDAVIKTPSHRVHAYSAFDLTFTLRDGRRKVRLVLEPNDDLIHDDFGVTILAADGTVRRVEKVARTEFKVFRGDAFIDRPGHGGWSKAGWARITVREDGERPIFDGAFRIDGDNHHVQTAVEYLQLRGDDDPVIRSSEGAMVFFRDSDVMDSPDEATELKRRSVQESLCDADSLDFNGKFDPRSQSPGLLDIRSLFGRQAIDGGGSGSGLNLVSSIGSVDGCPTTRKVALVGIATDCTYWEDFDTQEELRQNVISMVNKASQVYESTFKISLAIQNLTISEKGCPGTPSQFTPWNVNCSSQVTINDRLNTFSKWRGQFSDDNAYWTLLTKCATDSAVGLAWRGQLCRTGSGDNSNGKGSNETVAATNVVVRTASEWLIFAHESGHTFGAVHDCTASACPVGQTSQACCPLSQSSCDAGGRFIMNPSTSSGITQFSPCSIGNICAGLKSNMIKGTCLSDNKNVKTITGSQCGNGIVEAGEDCDCGGESGCKDNKCCDAKTCKFAAGAVCDATNEDCCTAECQFAANGTVCRDSAGVCDVAEVCPGNHAACPEDKHKGNGDGCGDGLACASGQCTSRDMQCKSMSNSLWGVDNTNACPDEGGCLLTCTSPDLTSGQCVVYNQYFLDGTSCGGGGLCMGGSCEGSSTIKEIGLWIERHKPIFIPVVCIVGGLLLVAIVSCIVSSVRKRSRRRRLPKQQPSPPDMSTWPSRNVPDAGGPAPWNQQQSWPLSSGAMANPGGNYPPPPEASNYPYPPPVADRQRSVRYA
ncbi:hypothetical protein DCS_07681 [Drechmeria coniospora]|uniref:Disintegrin and metalloproteinase domain-containing protein B n=1 Tax=Drechmeria coniospora TaxID=98403 RepID=A0A151GF52_DRECN|nr:hypothetical protein DCS_07681 [Drechmeria coniospora]KYK55717.1 hypothetical protein DCS_07681 [Drechmeria coniospora]ODA81683.1 hypothetical protein RJ55_00185 [Drechmeria coniospora]